MRQISWLGMLIASAGALIAVMLALDLAHAQGNWDERRLRQLAGQSETSADQVRDLLARGASPDVPDSTGRTALHAAAAIGAVDTLRILLDGGGNPHARDRDGNTPLHIAADASSPELAVGKSIGSIRLLLGAGADADSAGRGEQTPLHLAAGSHDLPGGIAALLRAGANPDRKDGAGNSPLHVALGPDLGWPGAIRILLDGGADPALANGAGLTALQLFVRAGPDRGRTATLLIDAGADPDRKYPNGDAPLHAAIQSGGSRGKVAVAEALLAGGADPCIRNADGHAPYQIATAGGPVHRALAGTGGHDLACGSDREPDGPSVAEEERVMRVSRRSNIRSGPGTAYGKVGLLEVGDLVRVTGESGEWLRIELPGGETAFVYGPLLEELEAGVPTNPIGLDWSIAENQPCQVWNYGYRSLEPFTWSGACVHGKASGEGRLTINDGRTVYEGAVLGGKIHGYGTAVYASGDRHTGEFRDGQPNGYGTRVMANGDRYEGEFRGGNRHGRGTYILAGGGAEICEWRDGERVQGSCAPVVPGGRADAPGRAEQPVRDPTLPGEATRQRVADWIDRCNDLWERELVSRTSVRSYDLMDEQEAGAYLAALNEYGGPVDAAREYIEICVSVSRAMRDSGRDLTCDGLGREIHWRIGERSYVLREADSLLGRYGLEDGDRRQTLEDYLRICVPAIVAAMEGRWMEPLRIRDRARTGPVNRSRSPEWLFPGTVASGEARNGIIAALGHDLVAGEGREDSQISVQAIGMDDRGRLGQVRLPPYEYSNEAYAPVASLWGYWRPSTLTRSIPKYQYSTYQEPKANRRDGWIAIQHVIGLLQNGEFGITRTTGESRRTASSRDAGFGHHYRPGYDPFSGRAGGFNFLHFLTFRKGAVWQGDALGFKLDGDSSTPVHGTARLVVTKMNPPLPAVRLDLEILWSNGDRMEVECSTLGGNPFTSDESIPGRVVSGEFLGLGGEEAIGTFKMSGYVGSFGLRR